MIDDDELKLINFLVEIYFLGYKSAINVFQNTVDQVKKDVLFLQANKEPLITLIKEKLKNFNNHKFN